jgi:hypothetical protein
MALLAPCQANALIIASFVPSGNLFRLPRSDPFSERTGSLYIPNIPGSTHHTLLTADRRSQKN